MKKLILIIVIPLSFYAKSQDVRTASITWSVNQLNDLSTNAIISYECAFKTNGMNNILWNQSSENFIIKVIKAEGTWDDISTPGMILFTISLDGESGTLRFERTSTGTSITIDLAQPGGSRLRHKYTVNQITAN